MRGAVSYATTAKMARNVARTVSLATCVEGLRAGETLPRVDDHIVPGIENLCTQGSPKTSRKRREALLALSPRQRSRRILPVQKSFSPGHPKLGFERG